MAEYYCPECRGRWSGAYTCEHRCVTCGSPIKAREPWRETKVEKAEGVMCEQNITHYCLGTGELKCDGCQQEKNWQMLNELPEEWRRFAQSQAKRIDSTGCILSGRPWYVPDQHRRRTEEGR